MSAVYYRVLLESFGLPCYFCGRPVTTNLHVHHEDHDHSNNDIGNLVVTHGVCHHAYHNRENNERWWRVARQEQRIARQVNGLAGVQSYWDTMSSNERSARAQRAL